MKNKRKKAYKEALKKKPKFNQFYLDLNPPSIQIQQNYHYLHNGKIAKSSNRPNRVN